MQSLFFLNLKFQASTHLLWLHSPVCVGPGWKPRRPVLGASCNIFSFEVKREVLDEENTVIILSRQGKTKMLISLGSSEADLHLLNFTGFLMMQLILQQCFNT